MNNVSPKWWAPSIAFASLVVIGLMLTLNVDIKSNEFESKIDYNAITSARIQKTDLPTKNASDPADEENTELTTLPLVNLDEELPWLETDPSSELYNLNQELLPDGLEIQP